MGVLPLLKSLPKGKRDINSRHSLKTQKIIAESKKFGEMYFDGPRAYGYGGYRYDGRWLAVAADIIAHYALKSGMRVLDIGCAKGFLVKDLITTCPGLEVFGIDVSQYALSNCEKEVVGRLHLGNALSLPFPDSSFDLVLAINSIHNLSRNDVKNALQEINRVGKGKAFIQVDAYRTADEKALFEEWVLTAEYHDYPENWISLFNEVGYTGDYNWTILEG